MNMFMNVTGLPTEDPGGHCHLFSHSVFERWVTCHWAKVLISARRMFPAGERSGAFNGSRDIFQNFKKSVLRSFWLSAHPWNRIRMAIFH